MSNLFNRQAELDPGVGSRSVLLLDAGSISCLTRLAPRHWSGRRRNFPTVRLNALSALDGSAILIHSTS